MAVHDRWPQHAVPRPELERPTGSVFGARLRALRHSRGYTQSLLAARANTTQQNIQRLERGRGGSPTWGTLKWLSEALNVPVGVLVGSEMVSSDPADWRQFWTRLDEARAALDKLDAAARVLSTDGTSR